MAEDEAKKLADAKALATRLKEAEIVVKGKAGEGGRLFGSITNKEIADAISAVVGAEIDKRKVELNEAVKALGEYKVMLRLHPQVHQEIVVHVIAS